MIVMDPTTGDIFRTSYNAINEAGQKVHQKLIDDIDKYLNRKISLSDFLKAIGVIDVVLKNYKLRKLNKKLVYKRSS